MATVNYSVPDDVKTAFNREFAGENKSAVVAELMEQAVAERRRGRRRAKAVDQLLALRRKTKPVSAAAVRRARDAARRG